MPKRNKVSALDYQQFVVRIPRAEYERVRKLAFDNNEPMSAVIRRAIREMKGRKA